MSYLCYLCLFVGGVMSRQTKQKKRKKTEKKAQHNMCWAPPYTRRRQTTIRKQTQNAPSVFVTFI
jgi:hypothetical protein